MKKILTIVLLASFASLKAQDPTYNQKLYYACKVFGFVKYYHSEVSTCQVDWDSVMLSKLPLIKGAVTKSDLNDVLMGMITAAGPMARATGTLPDTIAAELKFNANFSWIKDNMLRADLQDALDTIRIHFRPHPSCWVLDNDYNGDYTGWLVFPYDSAMHKKNVVQTFPNESNRLLYIFKYWNIIRYFNPYNDIMDQSWDSTLYKNILHIANAKNATAFYFGLRRFASGINDAHAEGLTYAFYISAPTYYYAPEILVNYIENQYVVVASNIPGIGKGSAITAINNLPVSTMEDSLRPYISAGNQAVFHRTMCHYLLNGFPNTSVKINFLDSAGSPKTINATRTTYIYEDFFFSYYPNDTLADVSYKKINCGIGYVNMGNLVNTEVTTMYNQLKSAPAIIFDIRNYPNGTIFNIANLMLPNEITVAKFKVPDVNYPGTFFWESSSFGYDNNPKVYTGKVIVMVNQETQSHAEYTTMILQAMPGAIVVGSQTAGADGNITYFSISRDLSAGFTTLGVFYPNGDSTQRIGIVPDDVKSPTRLGIMNNRDEVLERALYLANCYMVGVESIQKGNSGHIYPNPNSGSFTLQTIEGPQAVQVYDVNGKLVYSTSINGTTDLDLNWLDKGMYSLVLTTSNTVETLKFVIVE